MGGQTDSQVGWQVQASRKKVVNFTHIQLICDQLVSTCVGWPNGETTCVDLRTNLSSTKQATQVNASGWPNETQIERKSKTYVDLGGLANPFGQGLRLYLPRLFHEEDPVCVICYLVSETKAGSILYFFDCCLNVFSCLSCNEVEQFRRNIRKNMQAIQKLKV